MATGPAECCHPSQQRLLPLDKREHLGHVEAGVGPPQRQQHCPSAVLGQGTPTIALDGRSSDEGAEWMWLHGGQTRESPGSSPQTIKQLATHLLVRGNVA